MKKLALFAIALPLTIGCAPEDLAIGSAAHLSDIDQETVFIDIATGNGVAGSEAEIEREDDEFEFEVETYAVAGRAYTTWVCGLNNPSACNGPGNFTPNCSEDDLLNNAAADGFCQWGAGAVAESDGELEMDGTEDASGGETLFGSLTNFLGADIALVVRGHGAAMTGADLTAQLTTFNGGCPPNVCSDEQIASFSTN